MSFSVHSSLISELCRYQEFEKQIKQWCKEAGEDVTYKFAQVGVTSTQKTAAGLFCLSEGLN